MSLKGHIFDYAAKRQPKLHGLRLAHKALADLGWVESMNLGQPVDRKGNPLPWITYPAIHILAQRVPKDARVFEYGAGFSTLWWAARVLSVNSCEHDDSWAARVKSKSPSNAELMVRPLGAEYVGAIRSQGRFDIVVIDGRMRSECALESVDALTDRGIIVWDDTDRQRYKPTLERLTKERFSRLDLSGLAPASEFLSQTSILYRQGNCLGL